MAMHLRLTSPDGGHGAVLEFDDRVVYLYLTDAVYSTPPLAALWVANRGIAPPDVDRDAQRARRAPRMPRRDTSAPTGWRDDPRTLVVEWSTDSSGVRVRSGETVLGVIPVEAAGLGIPGYAALARRRTPVAFPLTELTDAGSYGSTGGPVDA